MAVVTGKLSTFRIPDGIAYARVPSDFPARCKAAGLGLQERSVLIALMTYQVVAPDGSIYLKGGTSKMIAANCGMSGGNVRKAITALRKKGVLGRTALPGTHRLELALWETEDSREKQPSPALVSPRASPEKQAAHPVGSASASEEKRGCFSGDAPLKKPEMEKKAPKKRGALRVDYG